MIKRDIEFKRAQIINNALSNLKEVTQIDKMHYIDDVPIYESFISADGLLIINDFRFLCIILESLTKSNFGMVLKSRETHSADPLYGTLVIANKIDPCVFDDSEFKDINLLDSSGNCRIHHGSLYIRVSGRKSKVKIETAGRAFSNTGIKVIFYFLCDDRNINKTFREIKMETGASLGTITNIIDDLKRRGYVLQTSEGRFLKNKKELLDEWQVSYNRYLKPRLFLKSMEFIDSETRDHWRDLPLPQGMFWGGEGGANLGDGYLHPAEFTIYTDVPSVKLMMTKKAKYAEDGSIKVYKKFWNHQTDPNGIAPRILLYADLMGTGYGRNIEAAQRLIENGI